MEDFEPDEMDELAQQAEMEMAQQVRFESDCRTGYDGIQTLGFNQWMDSFIFQTAHQNDTDAKESIVTRLIGFFESSHIEEYEKCQWLKENLDRWQGEMRTKSNEVQEDFYDWRSETAGSMKRE